MSFEKTTSIIIFAQMLCCFVTGRYRRVSKVIGEVFVSMVRLVHWLRDPYACVIYV